MPDDVDDVDVSVTRATVHILVEGWHRAPSLREGSYAAIPRWDVVGAAEFRPNGEVEQKHGPSHTQRKGRLLAQSRGCA